MFSKLIVLLSFLFAQSVMAEVIFFECKPPEVEGVHVFEAKGVAVVDDFNQIDGLITVKTSKASEDSSIQIFDQTKISGYLRHFQSGKISKDPFDQLILKTENAYLKNVNIIIGAELPLVSNILSVDNFMFRSNCYRVQE
jgi:hypothetical protein